MPELISIHIPKTAGSSFFQLLKKVYGKTSVLKINIMDEGMLPPVDMNSFKVLHGHIRISQLDHIIHQDHPRLITWLRDPVDRVISNYYFSMQRIREGKADERKLHTRNFSLPEYARMEENRNKASWFLEEYKPEEFLFIGLYEQFEADIRHLAVLLNWPDDLQLPHRKSSSDFVNNNDCSTQYGDIDAEMRREIAGLNALDVALYQQALAIRKIQ